MKITIDLTGPLVLLCLALVVLKVTGVITWSWWWVLLPLWGSLALGLCIALFFGAMLALLVVLKIIFG